MRLTKSPVRALLGRLPCQQLSGSKVALTTFIPSRPDRSTTQAAPVWQRRTERSSVSPPTPRNMTDLSTCFCRITAISHLENGRERRKRGTTKRRKKHTDGGRMEGGERARRLLLRAHLRPLAPDFTQSGKKPLGFQLSRIKTSVI